MSAERGRPRTMLTVRRVRNLGRPACGRPRRAAPPRPAGLGRRINGRSALFFGPAYSSRLGRRRLCPTNRHSLYCFPAGRRGHVRSVDAGQRRPPPPGGTMTAGHCGQASMPGGRTDGHLKRLVCARCMLGADKNKTREFEVCCQGSN